MGRRKIEIKPIRDDRNRSVTFLKRKGGLFKKAHELSVLCSVDVAVIIFGHNKRLYEYSSSDINEIVGRFQYYGGAHEHKGPQDFADKGGDDDDDDDEAGGEGDDRGTPQPEQHPMMGMQQTMQHHPGFQNVRHGTPHQSPPMHNGPMPQQFHRVPSPLPPNNLSRPSSRAEQHQGHVRRVSSNLVPPQHPQGPMPPQNYAYTPNPPFYNPQAAQQMQRPPGPPGQPPPNATYPPPYAHPQGVQHQQMQQVMMQDNRRSSMPPAFPPQPPPQPNMQRPPSQDHLQPPQHPQPHTSPRMQQGQPPQGQPQRPTPSPQPPQQNFASPPLPQPKPLPAAKSHSIFTPIDDSRSMLARSWGSTSNAEPPRSDPNVKVEEGPRSQSIDVAAIQRDKPNGVSPRPPPARPANRSPQPPQRTESAPGVPQIRPPTRSNTMGSDAAKRPRLKVQIPSEQSDGEGQSASAAQDASSTSQPTNPAAGQPGQAQPSHGVVLPPPSPSAGALLSAGAQGPPNPFARPAPPMSTNPHAANRDAQPFKDIETPISALPSRFMSDNLLPSPSTFYPEWGFGSGRSADGNMLPSPLNFQTPVVANGGWGRSEPQEDKKRPADEIAAGDDKRAKT